MTRFLCSLTNLLALTAFTQAQTGPLDPPVAGRPDDFSHIVGKYAISVHVEPIDVHVNDPITLHVRISGEGAAKYEPQRRNLQILPDWKDDFFLENVPDEDRVLPAEKAWLFVYRLRPKHDKVTAIDGIKLVYYDPGYRGRNKFLIDDAAAIRITVKPKLGSIGPTVDHVAVPDSVYHADRSDDVLASSPTSVALGAPALLFLFALPPVLCFFCVLAWRRAFPGGQLVQGQHRARAAQRALEQLRTGGSAWTVVCRYLGERFDFDVNDPTPADVMAFLKRRGFAKERCTQAATFYQSCDAMRFTGAPIDGKNLVGEATQLIDALEGDPCAR